MINKKNSREGRSTKPRTERSEGKFAKKKDFSPSKEARHEREGTEKKDGKFRKPGKFAKPEYPRSENRSEGESRFSKDDKSKRPSKFSKDKGVNWDDRKKTDKKTAYSKHTRHERPKTENKEDKPKFTKPGKFSKEEKFAGRPIRENTYGKEKPNFSKDENSENPVQKFAAKRAEKYSKPSNSREANFAKTGRFGKAKTGEESSEKRESSFDKKPRFDKENSTREGSEKRESSFDKKPRFDKENSTREGSDKRESNFDKKPRFDKENSTREVSDKRASSFDKKPRFDKENSTREGTEKRESSFDKKPRFDKENSTREGSEKRESSFDKKPKYDKESKSRSTGLKKNDKENVTLKEEMRLNRFLANGGISSRRDADLAIEKGYVEVNGKVVTELGSKVQPNDMVSYRGKRIYGEKKVYFVLNKPRDTISTMHDPEGRKTVMDMMADACEERIYPVGRLDRNTTGILIFTNDGDLSQKLTHPSFSVKKIYEAVLDKPMTHHDMQQLANGIDLEDGPIQADNIGYNDETKKSILIEIHSGKNHIVHRMFEHLGYTLEGLDRVYYAGISKKGIKRGQFKEINNKDLNILRKTCGIKPSKF